VLWSKLLQDDPVRLELELAKAGTTLNDLARDIRDVSEMKEVTVRMSPEARRMLALEHFGDQGHSQPEHRTPWVLSRTRSRVTTRITPDFGVLPRLEAAVPVAGEQQSKAKTPRHRPPAPIARASVQQLTLELAQRKARPHDRELTQENIAYRVKMDRSRIQQAEALERVGWDLLRSHPEFSANDGFVRWPSVEKAIQILASERAEN
jgi:hypothetical protein